MKINNEFDFGEILYLKTDIHQNPRMLIAIEVYPDGELLYKLISGTSVSYHYAMEITREKDVVLTTNN